jgi:hypothetical protein
LVEETFGYVAPDAPDFYKIAALEVASRIDAGEDGSRANAYHNPLHFAKILVNFMALSLIHQGLNSEIYGLVDDVTAAKGLLAAIAHDVCHDGKGNTVDGKHYPFRLEQIAIDAARGWIAPPLEVAASIDKSLTLVYATDVSGLSSPAKIIRSWYDYYFERGQEPCSQFPEQLRPIIDNRQLTLAAALLQDADVLSGVMENDMHLKEDSRVGAEFKRPPSPTGGLFFLDKILEGRMTTTVARRLGDDFIQSKRQQYLAIVPA